MPAKKRKRATYTEAELNKLSREDMIDYLTDREVLFCEHYIKDYNIKLAAIKAGYAPKSANLAGLKLRNKTHVNNYIAWLKLRTYNKACVDALDILNFYAKAAFSDITDYIEVINGRVVRVKPLDEVDGQLIQEVSQNSTGGVSFKLIDKMSALKRLESYMDTNPYDWQRKIEERKLELMEERLDFERSKGDGGGYDEDDGFIDALVKASQGVFDDEEDEEQIDTISDVEEPGGE